MNTGRLPLLLALLSLLGAEHATARIDRVPLDGRAYYLAVSDFNRDGRMDVAVSGTTSTGDAIPRHGAFFVALYEGSDVDEFRLHARVVGDDLAGPLIAADVNGNGFPDLASPRAVWFDPATEALANASLLPFAAHVQTPYSVAAADFNGDGRNEIAVADLPGRTVEIFTFDGQLSNVASIDLPDNPNAIVAADFDGDGRDDLAIAGSHGSLAVLHGKSQFSFDVEHTTGVGIGFRTAAAIDLNGDAKADLVALDDVRRSASLFFGSPLTAASAELGGASFVTSVAAGDVTGDGVPDVLIGQQDGLVIVFPFRAGGTPGPRFALRPVGNAFEMRVANVDSDAYADIIIADASATSLTIVHGPVSESYGRRRAVRP